MDNFYSPMFYDRLLELEARLAHLPIEDISFLAESRLNLRQQKIEDTIRSELANFSDHERRRGEAEFLGWGPLEELFQNDEISEILVNGWDNIWIEQSGRLKRHHDRFISPQSYRLVLDRVCDHCRSHPSVEYPTAQGNLLGFRVQLVGSEITQTQTLLSLRRHPKNPWNFSRLREKSWAPDTALETLANWVRTGINFLVVGPTGSGKTSVVNACLQQLLENERVLLLEDTRELSPPNAASSSLLTRRDSQNILPEISMGDLVRQSLRLRPDRLVLGEIRGPEAKDFLMALSTGHAGSFGTLHAASPHQALIRLEMLVQLGAPTWGLSAIRRLIFLSLQGIVVVEKDPEGQRRLRGLYQICSLEESGFLTETVWEKLPRREC